MNASYCLILLENHEIWKQYKQILPKKSNVVCVNKKGQVKIPLDTLKPVAAIQNAPHRKEEIFGVSTLKCATKWAKTNTCHKGIVYNYMNSLIALR